MSRIIYPSIRSDTGYNMQQPAAQVSFRELALLFRLADGRI